jgi:cytidylate kinase
MEKNMIINVGRQLGSGGHIIAGLLAERMQLSFYDKELIRQASRESGLAPEFFEEADETVSAARTSSLLTDFFSHNYFSNESLFQIQSDLIREISERESAVIVGRCSDYVLRDFPRCVNIFITADLPDRLKRVGEYFGLNEEKALALIAKTDKKRAEFYNFYSNKVWGAAASYDLCINSSVMGIDKTTAFIQQFVQEKLG